MIVAIDGPAGAGKSSVARRLARELGLTFLDTGAMYRAIALRVLGAGLEPDAPEDCARVARETALSFDEHGRVLIDGEPGEPAIRSEAVDAVVSAVSAHPGVRRAVVPIQRRVAAERGGVVAEGRDTTTVVFPDADHKFFLTASPRVRARRRALQVGRPQDEERIRAEIERRDAFDAGREDSPLVRAPDAQVLDTDGLGQEAVLRELLARIRTGAAR